VGEKEPEDGSIEKDPRNVLDEVRIGMDPKLKRRKRVKRYARSIELREKVEKKSKEEFSKGVQ
jgi:hypothetical protein